LGFGSWAGVVRFLGFCALVTAQKRRHHGFWFRAAIGLVWVLMVWGLGLVFPFGVSGYFRLLPAVVMLVLV
jgi:hypothetical protein